MLRIPFPMCFPQERPYLPLPVRESGGRLSNPKGPVGDHLTHQLLVDFDTGMFRRIGCRFVCFNRKIHGATFLRLIVSYTVVKRVCPVLCFKPFKVPFSISCGLYRNNEGNKKTSLSCCKIPPIEIPRFLCPPTTAPDRTEGLFWRPDGCNIAPGTDPAPEAVTEDFRNFGQRFSGADFCCRQTTASCVFVRQTWVCPTKTPALRGCGRSRVATLFLAIYGYQPKTDRHDRKEAPNAEL